MRFVIGAVALLVLGSIFGSLAGLIFWPDLSYATGSITLCENGIICSCIPIATIDAWAKGSLCGVGAVPWNHRALRVAKRERHGKQGCVSAAST